MALCEEIIEDYIKYCRGPCNKGGYFLLSDESVRESIIRQVTSNFNTNGYNPEEVSGVVRFCDQVVFAYFNELFAKQHVRIPSWGWVDEEKLREILINSFLPKA